MSKLLTSAALLASAQAAYMIGVDVSQPLSKANWECLRKPGGQGPVEIGIVRMYQSVGRVDPNGAATIRNAIAAGVPYVHSYIFPCVKCGNPGKQVLDAVNAIKSSGIDLSSSNSSTTLWLDVERLSWYSNTSQNQAFIKGMVDEISKLPSGIKLGVYTNYYNW